MIYDDWNLIAEYDETGQQVAKYVHGPRIDEVILTINAHGAFFHHHDVLGSTTHLTDWNGDIIESYTYDPFGAATVKNAAGTVISQSAYGNRFLFTGREYLEEIDLYDYRNRIYSAELGRFVQPDPIRFDAGDINIYRYVFNDPLGFTDPLGLGAWDVVMGIGKIHLGIVGVALGAGITVGTYGGGTAVGLYTAGGGLALIMDGLGHLYDHSTAE